MLCYDRIDVSEGIDVNKTSACKECIICHYWYILDKGFRFQPTVCNSCHNISMLSFDINNFGVLNIHGVNYHCIILGNSKTEAI